MADPAAAPVLFRRDGPVGWVVLNRPDKRNALDGATLHALRTILAEAGADRSLRVLVLTAEGPVFCAGADLGAVEGPGRDTFLDALADTFAALRRFRRPLVGAVPGLAVAGGLELALCCDLLVAAESARLGDAHVLFGLVPGGGAAILLPRLVGPARARQLLFTGQTESAATLRDWGLVNLVVPDAELLAAAAGLARHLASLSPEALEAVKALATDAVPDDLLAREAAAMRAHLRTAAAAEGLAAFREKRPPDFR